MHIYTQPKKAGESLSVSSTSGATPAQVVHCPAKPQKDCSDAEKDEESPSVSRMSIELLENVTQCIQKFPKKVECHLQWNLRCWLQAEWRNDLVVEPHPVATIS